MTSTLSEASIEQALQTRWLGRHVYYFAEIDSTNEWLKKQAVLDPSLAAGSLVLADFQEKGKGRLNRRWEVPAGTSLLFSLFFRLHWEPERANWLTMMAGLAVVEAVAAQTGLKAALKWPNDIVTATPEGNWKKLGGILLESTWKSGRMVQAVLGLGLNVNVAADELPEVRYPATSLQLEAGQAVDRLSLLAALLERLETHYEAACEGQSPMPAWLNRLILMDELVHVVQNGEESWTGIFEGVDHWGNLLLRSANGALNTITAGDVSLTR